MPQKLPVISGKDAVKAFSRDGWRVDRITGSHAVMRKEGSTVTLSVPLHQELKKGLLRSLIKDADIDLEKFLALLIILAFGFD
jgi:predicted RNA binding protein YcfA (HicA-like mRNA interferase family)